MGMTIEEHTEHLLDIMDSMPDDACGDWRDSIAYAINIMHKYQKIEEIVRSKTTRLSYDIGFSQIKKVVKDGKDIL